MGKYKITVKSDELFNICVEGIKKNNNYNYLENDTKVNIKYYKKKIIITRSNNEYVLTLNLELNKETLSTYAFIGGNKTFNLKTYTKELSISDDMILVKYNLEGNDFEFKFEVVEWKKC